MQDQVQKHAQSRWWILFALSGALALAFLDQMNLPVALPTIQKELDLSTLTTRWLINAYLLTWAVFVLTGGYLADYYGLRKVFCLGIFVFALASVGSAFSMWGWWFIAFRALQGFGTALMLPAAIGILVSIFPKKEQGRAIGIYSGAASIFLILGPLMGGIFTQFLNWRWIFIVNIPICILSYIIVFVKLYEITPPKKPFDFLGFFFFSLGFPCFILALMQGSKWGWGHWSIISLFSFSFVSLLIFFRIELKTKIPFLDLQLFKKRTFLGANFIFFSVQFILILPVYWAILLQRILGYSPLMAGLYVMIAVLPLVVLIPLGGFLSDVKGTRLPVVLGLILTLLSLIWFFVYSEANIQRLVIGMVILGSGIALIFAPISACVVGGVTPEKRGIASGVLGCIRQVGGTIGMATISSMLSSIRADRFFKSLKNSKYSNLSISEVELDCFYEGSHGLCKEPSETLDALNAFGNEAYFYAFKWVYLLCAFLIFMALISALFTIKDKAIQNKQA